MFRVTVLSHDYKWYAKSLYERKKKRKPPIYHAMNFSNEFVETFHLLHAFLKTLSRPNIVDDLALRFRIENGSELFPQIFDVMDQRSISVAQNQRETLVSFLQVPFW